MTVLGRERPIRRLRWTVLASSGLIAGGRPSFLAKPTRSLTWFSSRAVGSSRAEPLSARNRNPHLGRASDLLNAAPALRAAAIIVVERRRLKTPNVVGSASRRTAYLAAMHAARNRCYAAATHGNGNWQVAIHSAVRTGRPVGRGATRPAQLLTARKRVSGRARPPLSPSTARRLHTPPGMCQLRARPCADLWWPHIRPAASRVP
jgi:hypothetical protein